MYMSDEDEFAAQCYEDWCEKRIEEIVSDLYDRYGREAIDKASDLIEKGYDYPEATEHIPDMDLTRLEEAVLMNSTDLDKLLAKENIDMIESSLSRDYMDYL